MLNKVHLKSRYCPVFIGFFIFFESLTFAAAKAPKKPLTLTPPAPYDQTYQELTTVLQKVVVVNGAISQVDYRKFQKDQKTFLSYLKQTSAVTQKTYDTFSEKEKLAFLINAYNAFTLKLVADYYPVKSIKKIGTLFTGPWKLKYFKLLGATHSLDEIEHEMLRKQFTEPRVHFAVNCASIGCPALRNEAYRAEKLDAQLDEQAKLFLRDGVRNQLDVTKKTVTLSMIFKWFNEDFEKNGSTIQKFVSLYISDDPLVIKDLEAGAYTIGHSDYDWDLNDVKK